MGIWSTGSDDVGLIQSTKAVGASFTSQTSIPFVESGKSKGITETLRNNPTPYTLHPPHRTPHTPHPTPYTLYTVRPTHYTLHPTPYTLHPLHSTPYTLHPTPCIPHPKPYTVHPTPSTPFAPHPKTYNLHPTPHTLNPTTDTRIKFGHDGFRPYQV